MSSNLWTLVAALSLVACTDPATFVPIDELGGPRGAISGTVTYSGPAPCTRGGAIVGAAVLLAFEQSLLPPPEGLGTIPAGLSVVPGEKLFRGVPLTFAADGSLYCPPAGSPDVVASTDTAIAPLTAGVYQVRGFYDRDGNFNPAFSLFNLPTKGDVGGGAIDNAAAALMGAPVIYRAIAVGSLDENGVRVIPESGSLVEGVAISLGLPLPLHRPMFHVESVLDSSFGNKNASAVVVPSDYQLAVFSTTDPAATESSFVRLVLGAGVPKGEQSAASAPPLSLSVAGASFLVTRQDVNRDGKKDGDDHIPETALVPALAPLGLLSKLTGSDLAAQSRPAVILQGVTLLDGLVQTAVSQPDLAASRASLVVGLRPAVLCIDPRDKSKDAVLVNTHKTDKKGTVLIQDEKALQDALSKQFGRRVVIAYGCLPQGRYAMNLVYETGQAWTVPNEAGVCAPSEVMASDGASCGVRARLASQATVVTIGPPSDPKYCVGHPTPTACEP
jgi:hypothetical protein